MSEVKLNLTDSKQTIHGTIHGSIADRAVAALSAEPETIAELEAAMCRYMKLETGDTPFPLFRVAAEIDEQPWDAGIVIIDLAARIVASESTYSQPGPEGEVDYHDGVSATDITVAYRLPEDWIFLRSIAEYNGMSESRRNERQSAPPLDARAVLYGRQLLEFIFRELSQSTSANEQLPQVGETNQVVLPIVGSGTVEIQKSSIHDDDEIETALLKEISAIHARWLMSPRDELLGKSPREVLLERQDFLDYDLQTRELQWSFQGEGPPCLATDSHAYRFAGFGTHEWVIYYDLVRHLLWSAARIRSEESTNESMKGKDADPNIARLEEIKEEWLEQPQPDYDGRIPALLIENERRRLPIALRARDMIVDEDCPMCQMMADETVFGMDVGFWHLDGSHMDDDFAFSWYRTHEEWEAENRRREEFNREFDREWKEREARIARGEKVEDEFNLDCVETFTPEQSR